MSAANSRDTSETRITLERTFNAPRVAVWDAWTRPEMIAAWWGPEIMKTRVDEHDFRVGGKFRYVMVAPDGAEYPAEGYFLEIDAPARLVTTDEFGDDDAAESCHDDLPGGMTATCLLEDLGPATKLILHLDHQSAEDRARIEAMGAIAGWQSSFDGLAKYLAATSEGGMAI